MPPPSQINSVLSTDESLLIRCGGDFGVLCPEWQKSASGIDGVLDATTWELTSTACNFEANGVEANQVIRFDRPTAVFAGAGEWFAVESVRTDATDVLDPETEEVISTTYAYVLTLRRPGKLASVGQPPPSVANVRFTVLTMVPQLEEASFWLYQRFSLDDNIPNRKPTDAYDLRVLRDACVLKVLQCRYLAESRDPNTDFSMKHKEVSRDLADALEIIRLKWGPIGESQPSTSLGTMRLERG